GIEAQSGEVDVRLDLLVRQAERECEVFDAPIADRGFARTFRPQEIPPVWRPGKRPGSKSGSLTAARSAGQGLLVIEHDGRFALRLLLMLPRARVDSRSGRTCAAIN